MRRITGLFVTTLALSAPALAGPDISPEADAALGRVEARLRGISPDDPARTQACADVLPELELVSKAAPGYAYPQGLLGECRVATGDCDGAVPILRRYLSMVPAGAGGERVTVARQALEQCEPPDPEAEPPPPEVVVVSAEVHGPARVQTSRQLVPRLGASPALGGVGAGLELRLGAVGLTLGTGGYPLSGGLTLGRSDGSGGPYAEWHGLWSRSTPWIPRRVESFGLGMTAGWDWRPGAGHWSFKVGAGLGWLARRGWVLVPEVSVGPVIRF